MQNTSELYKEILDNASCVVQTRLTIGEVGYTGPIWELSVNGSLFSEQKPMVGSCVAREIYLTILPTFSIPRMAEINVESRLIVQNILTGEVIQASEWLPKGTFYIDTRQTDKTTGVMTIHGYDAMLKAEEQYIPTDSESTSWPRKMPAVVEDICYRMGVALDERTVLNDWDVQYPGDFTMREILAYIAGCHGGNWTITDENALRLVPLVPSGDAVDIGNSARALSVAPAFDAFSNVVFHYDGKDTFRAPEEEAEGRTLEIENPWATQEIADAVLAAISGYAYQPYDATGAVLDPAAELGDLVAVGGTTGQLASIETTFDALSAADIAAPSDEEVDHEYPYQDRRLRQTRREVAKATASIKVGVDNIESKVEGLDGSVSSIQQTVDNITLSVQSSTGSDGQTYASITLKVGDQMYTGQILLDGNVDVSGQLSADALYAALGNIADLTVDKFSTSRRVKKYLAGDTSDDNHIQAQDEELLFVSGVYAGGVEQATSPSGGPLYWESDPDADDVVLGSDGYPYLNGVRIFTTTAETDWPVYVYTYDELVKARFAFETWGDIYTPVLTMGAGNADGYNKGYFTKGADGLEIVYKANTGADIGMRLGTGGYMDLTGLRKPTNIAFTGTGFTVTVDGSLSESFNYTFNADGTISGIVDSTGHVTTVSGVSL